MNSRNEQLGMLGILSGDPALTAAGEQMLAKARSQAKSAGQRIHIGNGFIMDPDGSIRQDPAYAEFVQGQEQSRNDRQDAQNDAMLQRMLVGAQIQQSAPKFSTAPSEEGQAVLQTNPYARGGARVESHIPLTPAISSEARQKASEAERLATEADDLWEQFGEVDTVNSMVDIPSDWLRQSNLTRGLAQVLERQFFDPEELQVKARGNRFEQNLSNLAAGLALTGYELAERQKWSPFAPGLTREQARDRLKNVSRDFKTRAGSIRGTQPRRNADNMVSPHDARQRKTLKGVRYVETAPGEWEVDDGQ